MSDEAPDPAGNTQAFRAFAQREPDPAPNSVSIAMPVLVTAVIAALVVVVVVLIVVLG